MHLTHQTPLMTRPSTPEQSLVRNVIQILCMFLNQCIQGTSLLRDRLNKRIPARLNNLSLSVSSNPTLHMTTKSLGGLYLKKNIILQLTQEMNHLSTPCPHAFPTPLYAPKNAPSACNTPLPGPRNSKLDSLHTPQKVEDLKVLSRTIWCHDDVEWGGDFVF